MNTAAAPAVSAHGTAELTLKQLDALALRVVSGGAVSPSDLLDALMARGQALRQLGAHVRPFGIFDITKGTGGGLIRVRGVGDPLPFASSRSAAQHLIRKVWPDNAKALLDLTTPLAHEIDRRTSWTFTDQELVEWSKSVV